MGDNQIDDLCPVCKGSGEGWMLSDNGPDAHNIQVDCQECNGRGSLIGAYESMKAQLSSMNERYTKAGGDLFFVGIERDNLRSEVERLTSDNASLRGSCAKLGAEHAGMVRTVRKANREIASLRGQVDTVAGWHASALNDAESLRKDKDRLDALEANFWDVRHTSTQVGMEGDTSQSIEIVGSWMDAPRERVIGENYNENLRAAIDQAMTADAYPPDRPEYPEPDDEIPDFTRGSGNKARRRAELAGITYPPAAKTSDKP